MMILRNYCLQESKELLVPIVKLLQEYYNFIKEFEEKLQTNLIKRKIICTSFAFIRLDDIL